MNDGDIKVCVTTRKGSWYLCWRDKAGQVRYKKAKAQESKNKAIKEAGEHERSLNAKRGDPFAEHRGRPLSEHLDEFHEYLLTTAIPKHALLVKSRVRRLVKATGAKLLSDLDAVKFRTCIAKMNKMPQPRKRPKEGEAAKPSALTKLISHQTKNFYVQAIQQFTRWLCDHDRMPLDNRARQIIKLPKWSVAEDRRHDRRALDADTLGLLVTTAWKSDRVIEGFTGQERAAVYLLASHTGLRKSELATLIRESFDLSDENPVILVPAAYTKNGQVARIQLRPEWKERLQEWLPRYEPREPLFPRLAKRDAAKMVQQDCQAASIAYQDENGLFFDFHALRHCFVTAAVQTTDPRTAMELARLSDLKLLVRYGHAVDERVTKAVNALPLPLPKVAL